jgi:hypothetical protein
LIPIHPVPTLPSGLIMGTENKLSHPSTCLYSLGVPICYSLLSFPSQNSSCVPPQWRISCLYRVALNMKSLQHSPVFNMPHSLSHVLKVPSLAAAAYHNSWTLCNNLRTVD